MVNNIKLDICHAIALKLKDVATKYSSTIKIGGIVTIIVEYYRFDLSECEYDKVKGTDMIGTPMMKSMGLIEHVNGNWRLMRRVAEQAHGQAQGQEPMEV